MSRWLLRFTALGYLTALLLVPVGFVFYRAFSDGFIHAWDAVSSGRAVHALELTLLLTAITVPVNTVVGIILALALVRGRFPGRGLLNAVVDLPLALSPVVVGLALFLLYGRGGWLGGLAEHGVKVLFAVPGMVLATMFVSLPFVVREVVPVLREIGTDQEQAAETLPIYVQSQYAFDFNTSGAYAASVVLALIAIATVVLLRVFQPKEH